MKNYLFLFIGIICISFDINAQTIGNYPSTSVRAAGNIIVTPLTGPSNTSKISVFSSTNFAGVLTGNSSNGKVTIIDAKPVGTFVISVKAFSSSGASTTRTFTLHVTKPNCSEGNFNITTDVSGLSRNLNNVVVGDVNGDGKQDLIIAHEGFNTISIRLGDGHGNFTGTTEVNVGSHPYNVAVGDFDRDGKQDIATTNLGNSIVVVRLGDGTGNFINRPNTNVGSTPVGLAIGDFNNDGKQDLAVANLNSHTVSIRLGDGDGNFSGTTDVPVGHYPYFVAIGDFNNDGKQDLATASGGLNTISIRMGNGTGNFSGTLEVPVGTDPLSVAIGDFNGDGNQDLAAANYASNTVSIRYGTGAGTFTGNTEIPVGNSPYFITTGNFNGDNHIDFATANYLDNTVSIRLGDGLGGFNGTNDVSVGTYPLSIAVGEFNNDGIEDLAVSNYTDHTVSIRLGIPGSPPAVFASSDSPVCNGHDIHLNATGGNTYLWTGPNSFLSTSGSPVISSSTLNDSGNYVVTITDSSNCTSTASTDVKINPLPVVAFNLPYDTLYTNDPIQSVSGGTPAGGVYSGNGLLPGNLFDPAASGPGFYIFTYTYTDSTGCPNVDYGKVRVLLYLDVNDQSNSGDIKIYPNPVKDEFRIDLVSIKEKCNLSLFTPDGKLVKEWSVPGNDSYLYSTNGIADGIYFLKIVSRNGTRLMKVVKQG